MKFHSARCEVCREYFFHPTDVAAYRLASRIPQQVDLGGEGPWSGVRCICGPCIAFVSGLRTGGD